MDLSNEQSSCNHGPVDRGVSSVLSEISWRSNSGGGVGNPLGHDSRPRSSWSGQHFTRRIVELVRLRRARGASVDGGHGYRLRTGSRPANRTRRAWLAPVPWTGALFVYDSKVLGIVQAPMIVALALSTTALGTIIPSLQDSGSLNTRLGTHVLAAGSIGAFGPSSLDLCPDPQVRRVVAAYGPGRLCRPRADLRAYRGEIENPRDRAASCLCACRC